MSPTVAARLRIPPEIADGSWPSTSPSSAPVAGAERAGGHNDA